MMNINNSPELQRISRQGWALGISRWVFGVAFLFAAFSSFPEHKWAIGLGLLVFNQGIEALGLSARGIFLPQNRVDDVAERKTRHTIRLAAERGPDIADDPMFWADVEDRVEEEAGPAPAQVPAWKTAGLVIGSLAWRTLADLVGIIVVMAMTGG